jgi:anthranilate synthase component 2
MPARLLVIDNYDSFTFNLVQMFLQYPLDITVFRSDKLDLKRVPGLRPDYLLISPGPRDPAHAGISIPVIRQWHRRIPILGVCLGMQCINEVFLGRTVRAPVPRHGKVSAVHHAGRALFKGLPSPFAAARYHSLMVAVRSPILEVTARSDDDVIMGVSHPHWPLHGVQFHPESFMTEAGFHLVENFLRLGPLAAPERRTPHEAAQLTIH